MKYLRHLLICGLLLGSAALFAQSGESGVSSARLADHFLEGHPEFAKHFTFDRATGTARCTDAKAWDSFQEFKLAYPAMTVEDTSAPAPKETNLKEQPLATPENAPATGNRNARGAETTKKADSGTTSTQRTEPKSAPAISDSSISELKREIESLKKKLDEMGPNAVSTEGERLEQLNQELKRQQQNNQPR